MYPNQPVIQIIQANGDLRQADRSINAIEQLFKPLEKSLYKNKVVILFDKSYTMAALTKFYNDHPDLKTNNQSFELTVGNIEENYPNQNSWRKTTIQINAMESHQKISLARTVGDQITQQQFEKDMLIVFNALKKSWELAF